MNKPVDKTLLRPAGEAQWQQEYAAQIAADGAVRNRSGIPIEPLYTPRDWNGERYDDDVGYPGQPPYTRGIYATMHRGRTWTQRQLIGLGTPPDYNARLSAIIAQGATAVSLIPCNSVYRGYDMDEVHAELLGTCGVVVNTVEHMDACLAGVDLGAMSCAMNDPSPFTLLAFLLAVARRRGVPVGRDQRHVEPERLPQPLRREPHVLPHRAARRAADPRRPHRLLQRGTCRSGTRCRSSASTCSRPARRRPRRWRSRSPPRCRTPTTASRAAWIRTSSCRGSRSSSTSRCRSSRRSRGSAPGAASGRG